MDAREKNKWLLEEAESMPDGAFISFDGGGIDDEIANSLGVNADAETTTSEIEHTKENTDSEFHVGAPDDKKTVAENTDKGVMFSLSELIDPDTGADMLEMLMPMLALLIAKFTKWDLGEPKQVKKDFALDAKEKRALAKPLEKLFQETNVPFKNPWIALLIVFLFIFGMKLYMIKMARDEAAPETFKKKKDGRGRPRKNKPEVELQSEDIILMPNTTNI